MDRKDKLEGEEIQKGLEQFLEQELYGGGQAAYTKTDHTRTEADELDLSLAEPVLRRTESRTAQSEPRRQAAQRRTEQGRTTQGEPRRQTAQRQTEQGRTTQSESRRQTAQGQPARRQTAHKSTESVQREMGDRKTGNGKNTRRSEENRKSDRSREREYAKEDGRRNKKQDRKKNKKKKKNRLLKVLIVIAALFVICFIGLYSLVGSVYNKMTYKEAESFTAESMKEDGVINVLLIGNDSRLAGDDGRSDAMILVSISDRTKTITMTSLLRDMYVEIPGHDGNRLNAAYSYGGPELLMQTIEENFDIPVHRYALVNFQAFANLVDAVGGVDLELTNDEVQYVNGYLMEYNQLEGKDLATDFLDPSLSGMIPLNGPQALAYTRNRYIGTDFGRTERQRKVLSAVIGKLPGAVLTNSGELADGLFPNLTTNLKQGECFNLALNAWKFLGYDMVQQCVPIEGSYSNATIRDMSVLEVDFEANKNYLKSTLYGK